MRIMITGASGLLGSEIVKKVIDERLGQDVEFMLAQDRIGTSHIFNDDSNKEWLEADLDEVDSDWWENTVLNYNIDTIVYIESILNDGIYIPSGQDIMRYQSSDLNFIQFFIDNQNINIMYLSTDMLYLGDKFPNELNNIILEQPEGDDIIDPNKNYLLRYSSMKLESEFTLTSLDSEGLRILRPISIVSPNQDLTFPLISDINKAWRNEDLEVFNDGKRGLTFTHIKDLAKFILSKNLFDPEIYQTLTSRIINVCRYQNYLPEDLLIEKIKLKTESESSILYGSLNDNYPYFIRTPQVRNMVRIDIPSLPIEYIIEDIYNAINPIDKYQPIVLEELEFLPGLYLHLAGTVEPLSNISILISTGDTLSTSADENGNWEIISEKAQEYTEPSSGNIYATIEGIQFDTLPFIIPAAS